jgi:hypothetical protein
MFLWGDAGVGKSTVICKILGSVHMTEVHKPVPGQFFCGHLYEESVTVIVFENFYFDEWKRNFAQLKRFMAGTRSSVDWKGMVGSPRGSVMFVSNEKPVHADGFVHGVYEVEAHSNWNNGTM